LCEEIMTPNLRVVPLGGLGEVGKNMLALEFGDDIVVIDAGVMFPEEDMFGVDLVLPNITYLIERRENIRAILITHGHEDHIGALPYVLRDLDVPVYAPRLAHGLISVKLNEHRIGHETHIHPIEPGKPIRLGSFEAEFFRVCHSIPDAMGIALRTPVGLIVHTGDFKLDHTPVDGTATDFTRLSRFAMEGVFLLLSDSTYAETPGYTPSEQVVLEALDRIVADAQGRVMIATFASLISRIQQIIEVATRHGRKVAMVGRSMVETSKMAIEMGYLKAPPGVLLPLNEVKNLAPDRVLLVTTGSQGEPTSALVRIANQNHHNIKVMEGDTIVLSASPIPGNDIVINRTIDNLLRQGAMVFHSRNALVHVHGHAAQEELKLMLRLMQPRYFVPIHGEYRHLTAHASLANSLGLPRANIFVLEDGDVLELSENGGQVTDHVPSAHVFVSGRRTWDFTDSLMRERSRLSRDGVVFVVLPLGRKAGEPPHLPSIVSSGFLDLSQHASLLEKAGQAVLEALDQASLENTNLEELSNAARERLGQFLYTETGRRPLILSIPIEV
jgi:ribonuclease J